MSECSLFVSSPAAVTASLRLSPHQRLPEPCPRAIDQRDLRAPPPAEPVAEPNRELEPCGPASDHDDLVRALFAGRGLAAEEGISPTYATRLVRLTFLAPDIVAAILAGKQPAGLTANKLMADTRLPLDWSEQRTALGFT
jgi:hypothetical protein